MKASWISPFLEGLQSVVNVSGVVKGVISSSVSEGVEIGFRAIAPKIMKLVFMGTLLFTGVFMMALGLGHVLDSLLHTSGIGFLLTGAGFLALGGLYYAINK